MNLKYNVLSKEVYKNTKDSVKWKRYASVYLRKAKKRKDSIHIIGGYQFYLNLLRDSTGLKYADSILLISEKQKLPYYTLSSHFMKGNVLYDLRNFKNALDSYLVASNLNKTVTKNLTVETDIDFRIGLIKSRLGYYSEALLLFKKCARTYKDLKKDQYYIPSVFALGDTYRHLKKLDSAQYYNKMGYDWCLKNEDKMLSSFKLNQGADLFYLGKFKESQEKINSALPTIIERNIKPNIAMAYYFSGQNLFTLNNYESAIRNFKKVDSMYALTGDIHPELRETYIYLIKDARKRGSVIDELEYVNSLLKVDSLLSNNYKYLSTNLNRNYDTPKLLSEKERLLNSVKKKNKIYVYASATIISILILSLLYFYTQRKKKAKAYKIRFDKLTQLYEEKRRQLDIEAKPIKASKSPKTINIDDKKVQLIVNYLEEFETNQGYLEKNLTVQKLAEKIGTNYKYLSKTVHSEKGKSFIKYINDLRIEYAINRLSSDKEFRRYTIRAIALSCGFNTAESFSNIFYKFAKIRPSYFISELLKQH